MIKFYNPFKPHIVQFANGKFAVRKWRVLWLYKENYTFSFDEVFWWNTEENVQKFCTVNTYGEAFTLLKKKHVKDDPTKVINVYEA